MRVISNSTFLLLLLLSMPMDDFCADLVAESNNKLAILIQRMLFEQSGNIFFSPLSISIAMAMLLRGTKGDTMGQIMNVFGLKSENDVANIHERFENILDSLTQKHDSCILKIANALFTQRDFPLVSEFKYDLQTSYNAFVQEVDFTGEPQKLADSVNEWVRNQTHNTIPKIVDGFDFSTVMVLMNAMYFKGKWLYEFDPEYTRLWKFLNHGLEEQAKHVPMMVIKKRYPFFENQELQALELPYSNEEISMIIFLSKDKTGFSRIEDCLKTDTMGSLKKKMQLTKVEILLPKFHMEFSINLKQIFVNLGLDKIFSPNADFGHMSQSSKGLRVSEIVHRAALDVNEEGSEAAAATISIIQKRCLEIIPEFFVDHPFIFVIYHSKLDIILFIGKVKEL